jgi:hypothetical protein
VSGFRYSLAILSAFAALSATVVAAFSAPLIAGAAPATPELTIGFDDSPITYGGGSSTTISGHLRQTKVRSGVTVGLQSDPYPYTGDYHTVRTTTTAAGGGYKFGGVAPPQNTHYRVISTNPHAASDEVLIEVAIKVVLRLSDTTPHKRELIRFYGTAAPEHDGRLVYIQRRSHTGRWHSVKKTTLKDAGTELSRFSKHYRIRRDGTFRALVFHDSNHADGTSRTKHANVVRGG